MKVSNFRIRDRILHKNKHEGPQQAIQLNSHQEFNSEKRDSQNSDQFATLVQSFQTLLNSFLSSNQLRKNKHDSHKNKNIEKKEFDHRDRYIITGLPDSQNGKVSKQNLEMWIGNLCSEIFSISFNYYSSGKISYDQVKVFTSQSLLRNIAILFDNFQIADEDLSYLDQIMKQDVFPYLKAKYPMTVETDSNKALQKVIRQIDNTQALSNDFFSQTKIRFPFRQDGKYDDLIMQLLNQLMSKIDKKQQNTSNFQNFENFMTNIFEKSYDQSWIMNLGQQTQIKTSEQKIKYKQSVLEYTNYAIGRKIPESTEFFSEDEIKSGFLRIKNPSIFRILTKWSEQLWEKFENQNYYVQRSQGLFFVENQEIENVSLNAKKAIQWQIKRQKQIILEDMKKFQQINYNQYVQLMKGELQSTAQLHIQKYQKSSGKFAFKVVKNIQSFIVKYLNKLIHGLTTVSKIRSTGSSKNKSFLVSFKIGDIMRCKYSSKQKEVLKIFEEIQRISNENPEKMKIIRIKNRLKMGTNDILLNVKFNDCLVCQIQLAVNSVKNAFIKYSYNFNHYIYELERSLFGPIAQACSIWKNLEKRSKQFEKMIERQRKRQRKNPQIKMSSNSECIKKNMRHNLIVGEQKPFICSQCSGHYYHSNFMCSHLSCNSCQYWKCAVCIIEQNKRAQNIDFFLNQIQIKQYCKFWKNQLLLPVFGACIFVQKTSSEVIMFKNYQYNQKQYLFCKKDGQIVLMKQIKTKKQAKKFIQDHIMFQIQESFVRNSFQLTDKQLITKFILPNYFQNCFKQKKQIISILQQQSLRQLDINALNNHKKMLSNIKFLQISQCKLQNLTLIGDGFINLNRLNLNSNQFIKDFSSLTKFTKLQRLYLNNNIISKVPEDIEKLQILKQLDLSHNKIQTLPQNFCLLKSLTMFSVDQNNLAAIPQHFCQLQSLKILSAFQNKFNEFPPSLGKHKKLEIIYLDRNQIKTMPSQIQDLSSLVTLNLSQNKVISLPQKMKKMLKLKNINLQYNKSQNNFIKLGGIGDCKNLRILNLFNCQLENIQFPAQMQQIQCLQQVNLGVNFLTKFDQSLKNLKFLKQLKLGSNKFEKFDLQLVNLQHLEILYLDFNDIKQIPKQVQRLKKLKIINFNNNRQLNIVNKQIKLDNIREVELTNNKLGQIPLFSLNKTKLKQLIITSNQINLIPSGIQNLLSLSILNLSENQIQCIPDEVGKLSSLTELVLRSNLLKKMNPCIFKLSNLIALDLSYNQIQFIQNEERFISLKNLKTIYLSGNPLKIYPSMLKKMKHIQCMVDNVEFQSMPIEHFYRKNSTELMCFGHKILQEVTFESIPKWIQNIYTAFFGRNKFTIVPEIVFEAVKIKDLRLNGNKIKFLPDRFEKLLKLERLILENNQISFLPQSIIKLVNLKQLDISHNKISQIPTSIENLTNLNSLKASFNNIFSLPVQLGKLENLLSFNVANNKTIQIIPQEIGLLKKIQILILSGNRIKNIPQSILFNKNIKILYIENNNIQIIPREIINMTGLKDERLKILGNPLKQIEQYDFVYSKCEFQAQMQLQELKKIGQINNKQSQ